MKRMRKYIWWGMMTAAMAALPSCNKSMDVECPECNEEGMVVVKNDELVLIASKKGNLLNSGTWNERDRIGLFLTQGAPDRAYNRDSLAYSNIRATMNAGIWTLQPSVVKLTDAPAVVYAYYPFVRNVDPYEIPVDTENNIPYMFGTHLHPQKNVSAGNNVASIEMQNALSMVEVNVRKHGDCKGNVSLSAVVMEPAADSVKLAVKGTMDLYDGYITPTAYGEYRRENLNVRLEHSFTKESQVRIYAIPHQMKGQPVNLTIQVEGNTYSAQLDSLIDLERGVRNIYNILFTGETIEIEDVDIKEWVDVELEGNITGK